MTFFSRPESPSPSLVQQAGTPGCYLLTDQCRLPAHLPTHGQTWAVTFKGGVAGKLKEGKISGS